MTAPKWRPVGVVAAQTEQQAENPFVSIFRFSSRSMRSSNLCCWAVYFEYSVADQQPQHWKDHMFTLLQCIIRNISIQMSFSSWSPRISSTIKNHSGFSVQSGTWQVLEWWDLGGFLESILYNEPTRKTLVAYFFYSIHCIKFRDFDTMASSISGPKFTNWCTALAQVLCVCAVYAWSPPRH